MTVTIRTYNATAPLDAALAPLFALCAWVTLNPYFLWNSLRHMAVAGMLSGCLAIAALLLGDRPRRREVPGFILICLFVLYISMLPKVDGSTTRWYFVLPTIFALAVFSDHRRGKVLQWFGWIFAISLIPGIVVSLGKITGLPVQMDRLPLLNPSMAQGGGFYMHAPGALLLSGNHLSLPWGGELYRLCAMYDEPGMVGTLSAFLLAGNRFRLKPFPFLIIFVGGVLSFSLAFIVMASIGFLFRLVQARSPLTLLPLAILGLFGLLVLGIIKPSAPATQPHAAVTTQAERMSQQDKQATQPLASHEEPLPTSPAVTPPQPEQHLRQTEYINNRSLPEMDKLFARYLDADTRTLLFGLGADSSVVYGGVSQVVTRILTDFGLIGALLFGLAMVGLTLAITHNAKRRLWVLLFFALFALSIYQRPIVWMPYAFTMFICSSTLAGRRKSNSPTQSAS
ncbi:hypothetical protein [Pseudomonas sp. LS.1a]|uniref:hypothetical protein n=1 Tax=Pseudomonas sp. LS.1a TaxID=2920387 RepID=UPI001F12EE38|nr:hypothetical protein [Pseudomonas sp. LS.1a]UMY62932.1 hypothetical protein MKK04_06665 [Pseudomonas sp. LS.1a]